MLQELGLQIGAELGQHPTKVAANYIAAAQRSVRTALGSSTV